MSGRMIAWGVVGLIIGYYVVAHYGTAGRAA